MEALQNAEIYEERDCVKPSALESAIPVPTSFNLAADN